MNRKEVKRMNELSDRELEAVVGGAAADPCDENANSR